MMRRRFAACAVALLCACGGDKATGPSHGLGKSSLRVVAEPTNRDTVLAAPLQALVVEVRDEQGAIAPGVVVRFESAVPTDSTRRNQRGVFVCGLSAPMCGDPYFPTFTADTTDANGRAKALVRFGTLAGPTWVIVTVPEFGILDSVPFTTTPGAGATLVMARRDTAVLTGGKYRIGGALADRWGNPRSEPVTYAATDQGIAVSATGEVTGKTLGRHFVLVQYQALKDTAWTSVVPSGRLLAYGPDYANAPVLAMDFDGANRQQIARGPGTDQGAAPRWMPGGRAVFHGIDAGFLRLFVSDGAGGKRRLTTSGTALSREMYGDVSPDGAWVYFSGNTPSGPLTLWRVRADGTGEEQLINDPSPGVDWRGTLSRDGRRIVYVSSHAGYAELRTFDVATRTVTRLVAGGQMPHWSPDGTRIAYVAEGGGSLYVINASGTNPHVVSKSGYYYDEGGLDWTSDGQWLVARRGEVLELVSVTTSETMPLAFTTNLMQPAVR